MITCLEEGRQAGLVAKDDLELLGSNTVVGERRPVTGVGVCGWACVLEELRVWRPSASLRAVVVVPAAELVRAEGLAPALASNHHAVRAAQLQRGRARLEQVLPAPHHRAQPMPLMRCHCQRHVVSIHQAHGVGRLVVVAVVEDKLGKRGWTPPANAAALEAAAAVAGDARELAMVVCAASACPDAAGPMLSRGGE